MLNLLSVDISKGHAMAIVNQTFQEIDIELISPDPNQPRKTFDESSLKSLANTYRDKGALNPIRVRANPAKDGHYIIIGGERRYRAASMANVKTMQCMVSHGELSRADIMEDMLVDNMHRVDLDPVEQANGLYALMQERGWHAGQLAGHLHLNKRNVEQILSLLNLTGDVQSFVSRGMLLAGAAYEIAKISDPIKQRELTQKAIAEKLTAQQVKAYVARLTRKSVKKQKGATRVQINLGRGQRVVVVSNRNLNQIETGALLATALREIQADQVASTQNRSTSSEASSPTLVARLIGEFIKADQPTDLKAAVELMFLGLGPMVIVGLYGLLSHENPVVRDQATAAFNDLPADLRAAIHPLRPRAKKNLDDE